MVTSAGELCLLTAASVSFEIFPRIQCVDSWNPNWFAQIFPFSHSPPFSLLLSDHQLFIIVVFGWCIAMTWRQRFFATHAFISSCFEEKVWRWWGRHWELDLQSRLRDSWRRRSGEVEMLQASIGTSDIYNPVGRLGENSHRSGDSQGYRRRRDDDDMNDGLS